MRSALMLFSFFLLSRVCALAATAVWIDADPSIGPPWREVDDAFALILAMHSPELEIVGISATYGNASVRRTTAVARDLVRRFGGSAKLVETDVHAGAISARDAHRRTAASEALARILRQRRVTYIALGPLTNLAAFLHLHPELARQIERVIFVGGRSPDQPLAFGPQRTFRIHDANVVKDPVSTHMVLSSGVPITLTGVETARQLALTRADFSTLRESGPSGEFLHRRTRIWLWFWRSVVREEGGLVFDVLATMAAIRPGLLETERRFATLNEKRDLLAHRSPVSGARPVRFSTRVESGAKRWLLRRLRHSAR